MGSTSEGLGGGVQGGGLRVEQLRGTRWRDREGPQGAGAEADCAFYVGETAEAYLRAEALGDEQADAFTDRHPPDLVVEINVSHIDEGKPAWYRRSSVIHKPRMSSRIWRSSAPIVSPYFSLDAVHCQANYVRCI